MIICSIIKLSKDKWLWRSQNWDIKQNRFNVSYASGKRLNDNDLYKHFAKFEAYGKRYYFILVGVVYLL